MKNEKKSSCLFDKRRRHNCIFECHVLPPFSRRLQECVPSLSNSLSRLRTDESLAVWLGIVPAILTVAGQRGGFTHLCGASSYSVVNCRVIITNSVGWAKVYFTPHAYNYRDAKLERNTLDVGIPERTLHFNCFPSRLVLHWLPL